MRPQVADRWLVYSIDDLQVPVIAAVKFPTKWLRAAGPLTAGGAARFSRERRRYRNGQERPAQDADVARAG